MPHFDTQIPLQDFAPDADSTTEGNLLDMNGFYPEISGYRTLPAFVTVGNPLPRTVLGGYIGQLVNSSTVANITVAAVNNILYTLNGNIWVPQLSGLLNTVNRWRFAVYGQDIIAVNGIDPAFYFRLSPTPVTNEAYATGNGTVGPYTHTALNIPIAPGTVSVMGLVSATMPIVAMDDSNGNLIYSGQKVGTVNYTTGAMSVTSLLAVPTGTAITVSYTPAAGWQVLAGTNTPVTNETYGTGNGTTGAFTHTLLEVPVVPGTVTITATATAQTNETVATGNGTVGPYTHTAADFPIIPGTIVITVANQSYSGATDNGNGLLINFGGFQVGTVNYTTGVISLTFKAIIQTGNAIKMSYTPSQVVTDDGAGNLIGNGSGTINYQTGAASVTFTASVPNSAPITVNYTPYGTPPPTPNIVFTTAYSVILIQTNSQILWSNLSDTASWQPSVSAQVYKQTRNTTEGNITAGGALRGGAAVYKAGALEMGTFVGGSLGWSWQTISTQVGISSAGSADGSGQGAIVNTGDFHYFVGPDDFWQFDGYNLSRIPNNVKEFFFRDVNTSFLGLIEGRYDRVRDLVVWHYPSTSSSTGALDSYIGFYVRKGNWFFGRLNIDLPMGGDFSTANAGVGLFLTNHQLNNYSDSAPYSPIAGAYLTTWDVGDRRSMYKVRRVIPGFQLYPVLPSGGSAPAPAKLISLSQYTPGYPGQSPTPEFTTGSPVPISASNGWFNLVNTAKMQRYMIKVYGPAQLNTIEVSGQWAGAR